MAHISPQHTMSPLHCMLTVASECLGFLDMLRAHMLYVQRACRRRSRISDIVQLSARMSATNRLTCTGTRTAA